MKHEHEYEYEYEYEGSMRCEVTLMIKDSSVTITINLILTLSLLLLTVFCGNAVLWKVMEKSGKNIRIFPQLTHNTWKSREKRPTFPHYHKTFSLRSLKCGKTRYLNSEIKVFAKTLKWSLSVSTQLVFFHIPTISGYFYYSRNSNSRSEKKKNAQNLRNFNEMTFILRNFMVYKNGNFNCRRGEKIIVADQSAKMGEPCSHQTMGRKKGHASKIILTQPVATPGFWGF
jgi:hypothetical protein